MHGSAGLHSAMAIKRQRRLREQAKKRAMERRLSNRTDSQDSMDHPPHKRVTYDAPKDHALATSIGMLHLGVCFLVLGIFLIGSGLLPDDVVTWRGGGWWNELVVTGIFVTTVGVFLVGLNRVMGRKEENELNDYVQRQLTRSRSGHRLERDVETGCLTTKHHRQHLEKKREDKERGLSEAPAAAAQLRSVSNSSAHNGDAAHLEKILEEDVFERVDEEMRQVDYKETMSTTTTASLSPGTPSETRELLVNGRHYSFNSRQ